MTNPIRVYLDSSDFSNFSRPTEKNAASIQTLRSKLLNWVENGDIEIRYSMAHIMEAVPVDLDTAELGRLRLNCIKELCGKKFLPIQSPWSHKSFQEATMSLW